MKIKMRMMDFLLKKTKSQKVIKLLKNKGHFNLINKEL